LTLVCASEAGFERRPSRPCSPLSSVPIRRRRNLWRRQHGQLRVDLDNRVRVGNGRVDDLAVDADAGDDQDSTLYWPFDSRVTRA
jgi:hypothetical protein